MSEFCLHWYGRNIVHRLKYTRYLRSRDQLPSRQISNTPQMEIRPPACAHQRAVLHVHPTLCNGGGG
ncbi:hypothetical protein FIBSPDRAFT_231533 [Athelia psychrophila]|uniref:Uncharacterized protein n=1 Tax=Athelia psychrophila TaxID=1759441 RepID=A0A165YM03_9AGAM|nr:hypothetical protein FIBSPDRAFT_231533 [Fibularhizoctonia sp. CBS 109695]